MNQETPIPISDLNLIIKEVLAYDPLLKHLWITGEITSFKPYNRGSMVYLTLSDEGAQISCVMYENALRNLKFTPEIGQTVVALGKVDFYHKRGTLNFQVHYLGSQGDGQMSQAFQQLKEKLANEGVFDAERKQPIPEFPNHLALIVPEESAAKADILKVLTRDMPQLNISIIHATVQGPTAMRSITDAFDIASSLPDIDLILVSRGGGASEDFAPFNTEEVVRRIADCTIPVLTGIGHDIDITLADFAADASAATPTAAAHSVAAPTLRTKTRLKELVQRLKFSAWSHQNRLKEAVFYHIQTAWRLLNSKQRYHDEKIQHLLTRLEAANPLHKLKQGYSITSSLKTGKTIKSVSDIHAGDDVIITLHDGSIKASVI